jgi:hypothetical protein
MKKYIIYTIKEYLGLNNDYHLLLEHQEQILDHLQKLEDLQLENQSLIVQTSSSSFYNYLTFKNLLWFLFFLGFIGGSFWFYHTDFLNTSTLESIKDLSILSKNLHHIDHQGILEALKKLNENSVHLSKEEIKLLLEIKNLLLKKGIHQNPNLDRPIHLEGTIEWGDFKD